MFNKKQIPGPVVKLRVPEKGPVEIKDYAVETHLKSVKSVNIAIVNKELLIRHP